MPSSVMSSSIHFVQQGKGPYFWKHYNNQWTVDTSTEFDMLRLILGTEHAAFVSSVSDSRTVLTYANSQLLLPFFATL